jgi:hypothetical protein
MHIIGGKSCTKRASGISGGRLNPYIFEEFFFQYLAIGNAMRASCVDTAPSLVLRLIRTGSSFGVPGFLGPSTGRVVLAR